MKLNPYISFEGNCEEALNFYKDAIGGELTIMRYEGSPMEDKVSEDFKQKVLHGRIETGDLTIMASDVSPEQGTKNGNHIQLNLDFTSEDEQTETFNKLAEGANVTMPLDDQFWGAKFGMLIDKFGINWMFNFNKTETDN